MRILCIPYPEISIFVSHFCFNPEILIKSGHSVLLQVYIHACGVFHARPMSYVVLEYETIFVYTGQFSHDDVTICTTTNKID